MSEFMQNPHGLACGGNGNESYPLLYVSTWKGSKECQTSFLILVILNYRANVPSYRVSAVGVKSEYHDSFTGLTFHRLKWVVLEVSLNNTECKKRHNTQHIHKYNLHTKWKNTTCIWRHQQSALNIHRLYLHPQASGSHQAISRTLSPGSLQPSRYCKWQCKQNTVSKCFKYEGKGCKIHTMACNPKH